MQVLALCLLHDEAGTVAAIRCADPLSDSSSEESWAYRSISKQGGNGSKRSQLTQVKTEDGAGESARISHKNGACREDNFYLLLQALLAQLNAKPASAAANAKAKAKSSKARKGTDSSTTSTTGGSNSAALILSLACLPPLLAHARTSFGPVSDPLTYGNDSPGPVSDSREQALKEAVLAPENVSAIY